MAFHRLQEIQSLKLKLAMAEQEKLDMFKAAAGIAAQHGLNLKEFVSSVEARSREVLLLNTVREKNEEIQLLVHKKSDHFQAKWVEEKLLCQNIVEALCGRAGAAAGPDCPPGGLQVAGVRHQQAGAVVPPKQRP